MIKPFGILLITVCLFFNVGKLYSQKEIDSLKYLLDFKYKAADTNRLGTLMNLSYYLCFSNPDSAIILAEEVIEVATLLKSDSIIPKAITNIAYSHMRLGELDLAIEKYMEALTKFEKLNQVEEIINIEYGIGEIYQKLEDDVKANEYFNIGYQHSKEANSPFFMAMGHLSMADLQKKKNPDSALVLLNASLEILAKSTDYRNDNIKQNIYQRIGESYFSKGHLEKALKNYKKSLGFVESENDQYFAEVFGAISNVYLQKREFEMAIIYADSLIYYAQPMNDRLLLVNGFSNLSIANEKLGNFGKSLGYYKLSVQYKDSLFNHKKQKYLNDIEAKYQNEKKEQTLKLKNVEIAHQKTALQAEEDRGKFQWYIILLGGVLLIFVVLGLIAKQRVNKKIEKQHTELQYKTLQITDSIDYAKRIQQGMFPSREKVLSVFPEICIYHNPKDIVSGDFYWVFQKGNRKYLAVVDCTGHGVPGAFMTIIGINILNQIIENDAFSKPHEIVQELNTRLRKLLSTKKNTKDGMDIGLVCIEGSNLEFSGTHISCYLSAEKEIIELKGQRGFIGYSDKLEIETQKASLENTQMIYLFTDGFPDQKGGENGRKYYCQPFVNFLHEIATNDVDIQHDKLKKRFMDWKGNLKQLDDVLVVGFKA